MHSQLLLRTEVLQVVIRVYAKMSCVEVVHVCRRILRIFFISNLIFYIFIPLQLANIDAQKAVSKFVTFLVARRCLDLRGLCEHVFQPALQHARLKGIRTVVGLQACA